MNEKSLILSKLKKFKHLCEQHRYGCSTCPYFIEKTFGCQVKQITYELCRTPKDWPIEKIEKELAQ